MKRMKKSINQKYLSRFSNNNSVKRWEVNRRPSFPNNPSSDHQKNLKKPH